MLTPVPKVEDPLLFGIASQLKSQLKVESNYALCNRYVTGKDCVAWHCDDEPNIDQSVAIASISLGGSRDFQMRSKTGAPGSPSLLHTWTLNDGDLFIMKPGAQKKFEHCVPKRKKIKGGPRINLTFRKLKSQ